MDADIIKYNELHNDGLCVHLYYQKDLNLWISYGYSAYSLRLFVKSNGFDNIRHFSYDLMLPSTIVGSETVSRLRKTVQVEDENEEYILFRMHKHFEITDYLEWDSRLRDNILSTDNMDIETPISQYIPKDKFIRDGMSTFSRYIKRSIDFFTSFIALLFFSPLFLIIYIAIKLDDGGPAIYKQERIGRFGIPFYIYKFRSMKLDAELQGPQLSSGGGQGDTRLTRVGAFIRAHHLDELPQLWNVFCGDMAFVGPRPERAFYIDQILEYDKRYTYLYQIRPGVTSYATFYNGYTDTMEKMLRRLEYDLYYLGHRSFFFDIKILAMTFFAIIFGKKF